MTPTSHALHRLLERPSAAGDDDQRPPRPPVAARSLGGDAGRPLPNTSSRSRPTPKVSEFGIDTANMFGFWEWVGAATRWIRRSASRPCWRSAPTVSARCSTVSRDGRAHFLETNLETNLPASSACSPSGTGNFDAETTRLPYDQYHRFRRLPPAADQSGTAKGVTLDRTGSTTGTGAIFWGDRGPTASIPLPAGPPGNRS